MSGGALAMSLKIEAIDHVTVQITDVPRAKSFYGGLLGLEELERPKSFDFPGAWYRAGNAMIHLVGQEKPDPQSRRHFCLWVEDIKEAARTLEAAGYEIKWDKRKIPGIDRFFIHDPDGNRVEFQGSDGTTWAA
jgi:glyoxylase I family protein